MSIKIHQNYTIKRIPSLNSPLHQSPLPVSIPINQLFHQQKIPTSKNDLDHQIMIYADLKSKLRQVVETLMAEKQEYQQAASQAFNILKEQYFQVLRQRDNTIRELQGALQEMVWKTQNIQRQYEQALKVKQKQIQMLRLILKKKYLQELALQQQQKNKIKHSNALQKNYQHYKSLIQPKNSKLYSHKLQFPISKNPTIQNTPTSPIYSFTTQCMTPAQKSVNKQKIHTNQSYCENYIQTSNNLQDMKSQHQPQQCNYSNCINKSYFYERTIKKNKQNSVLSGSSSSLCNLQNSGNTKHYDLISSRNNVRFYGKNINKQDVKMGKQQNVYKKCGCCVME